MVAFLLPLLPMLAVLERLPVDLSMTKNGVPSKTIIAPAKQQQTVTLNWLASYNDSNYWNLPNGGVTFEKQLLISVEEKGTKSVLRLSNPVFLGSGGSGAVFSFRVDQPNQFVHINNQVAIKVSWKASRSTVENECNILRTLESNNVPHVERCLAQVPYDEGRIMIALRPVVMDRTSSLAKLSSTAQENAIRQVVETTIGMLLANVITVDLQPLVSDTGDVLFIDFTEAKQLSSPPSASDLNGLVGFCNEILALIPVECRDKATILFQQALQDMEKRGFTLEDEIYTIVDGIFLGGS